MTLPRSSNRTALYIVGGVLAFVVLGALSFAFFRTDDSGAKTTDFPTTLQGAVVVAGKAAPTTIEVYEDFLCPICARFESKYGADLAQAVAAGKAQVRYHPVAILNRATDPPGYAGRAANASICAAAAGKFPAYHDKLFTDQPAEGSAGLTDQELIAKGQELGIGGNFAQCVTSGKNIEAVKNATNAAAKDVSLRAEGANGFGTPTVLANGKRVDWSDGDWLANVTK